MRDLLTNKDYLLFRFSGKRRFSVFRRTFKKILVCWLKIGPSFYAFNASLSLTRTKAFRAEMALVLWALLLAVLVPLPPKVVAAVSELEMEPRLWNHELKKTYCAAIERHRIYKLERLDVYCAGKVAFFDDMVSQGFAVVSFQLIEAH